MKPSSVQNTAFPSKPKCSWEVQELLKPMWLASQVFSAGSCQLEAPGQEGWGGAKLHYPSSTLGTAFVVWMAWVLSLVDLG